MEKIRKKFDNLKGKVVFLEVEPVTFNYPEGTLKVEAKIYPVGSGSYSSFIYTQESIDEIIPKFSLIANDILDSPQGAFSSREISKSISSYLNPLFPKK